MKKLFLLMLMISLFFLPFQATAKTKAHNKQLTTHQTTSHHKSHHKTAHHKAKNQKAKHHQAKHHQAHSKKKITKA